MVKCDEYKLFGKAIIEVDHVNKILVLSAAISYAFDTRMAHCAHGVIKTSKLWSAWGLVMGSSAWVISKASSNHEDADC